MTGQGQPLDWPDLVSHIAQSLGISMRDAWDTDLPDVWALLRYWRKHPPAHLLIASRYSYKAPTDADLEQERAQAERGVTRVTSAEFDALLKQHGIPHG